MIVEYSFVGRPDDWFLVKTNPDLTDATLETFERKIQIYGHEYCFRLRDDAGKVLALARCNTAGHWKVKYAVDRDEVLFRATLALADSPLRRRTLLMQRIANLVQSNA